MTTVTGTILNSDGTPAVALDIRARLTAQTVGNPSYTTNVSSVTTDGSGVWSIDLPSSQTVILELPFRPDPFESPKYNTFVVEVPASGTIDFSAITILDRY